MAFRPNFIGGRTGALLLLAASITLHALVFGRLTGWLGGEEGGTRAPSARPVEVALLPPLVAAPAPVTAVPRALPPEAPPRAVSPSTAPPRRARPAPTPAAPAAPRLPVPPSEPAVSSAAEASETPAGWEAPETLPSADNTTADAADRTVQDDGAAPTASVAAPPVSAADTPPPPPGEADIAALPIERTAAAAALPVVPGLPASHSRQFRVYWGDFTEQRSVARLAYRLTREDDRYEIRTEGEAEGLIALFYSGTLIQVSRGRLGPEGLQPQRYAEQRGKRAERSVSFDQEGHRLLPVGGAAPVPLPPGTQDRLSVIYQIGLLARADPASFVAGATRDLPVATLRTVQVQRFTVVGDTLLMAPGGPIRSLHLHRPPTEGSGDPSIDLWLGYDFDMLPVRLRLEDAGHRVLDQLIERDS
jgi:hypothetical protein